MPVFRRVRSHHPPCVLRARFSPEPLLLPLVLSSMRKDYGPPSELDALQGVSSQGKKVPKPPGSVSRTKAGGREGYNLKKTVGWSDKLYDKVQVMKPLRLFEIVLIAL